MKIKSIRFLAKANIKGNLKSKAILVFMILMVASITLISSYSVAVTKAVNIYNQDIKARSLELEAWNGPLTEDVLDSIRKLDHVESVDMRQGMRDIIFDVVDINDENGTDKEIMKKIKEMDGYVDVWSLIGNEKRDVIAGKSLEETPTFSCIIPSLFYPFEYQGDSPTNLDYLNGEDYIGKTITVKAFGGSFDTLYNYYKGDYGGNEWVRLPALEYKLKVVGVYYAEPTGYGYYDTLFVSAETSSLMVEQALKAGGYDLKSNKSDVAKWWNNPSYHIHFIVVDSIDNLDYVYNEVTAMGLDCADDSEFSINESIVIISAILSTAGVFLIFATVILCIVNLIQSTTSSLKRRKGEIGLLKAIGYKNRQVFACLCYEQMSLTFRGFLVGGALSAVFVAISNFINNHKYYADRLYIISWDNFLVFLAISLCIAIIVPLICQLITLYRLTKIQPKDAMDSE